MSSNECVLDANEKEIEYLEYLEQENAAPVTISGYRWIIRAATSGLRDAGMEWEPERWTRNEVNYVRNVIFGKQKNGVRRRHLSVLNKYLQWYDNKVIQEMKIKWPSDEEMPTEHLLPLQALAVLDAARGVERIVVHLELNMGLRRVEVRPSETKELQGHRPGGPREGPGGGKWRSVPYHFDTLDELRSYNCLRENEIAKARAKNPQVKVPDALLIYERSGALYPYRKTALDNMVKAVSERVGLQFSNHTLRRTYGRTLWDMNKLRPGSCPIETIAELMGHEDIRTTIKYLGINLDDMTSAMSALSEYQMMLRQEQNPSLCLVGSGQSGISV